MKLAIILINVCCFIFLNGRDSYAQTPSTQKKNPNAVVKYDSLFNGIGPIAYFLPQPRSKVDVLSDEFSKTLSFQDTLQHAIIYQDIIASYSSTANVSHILDLLNNYKVTLTNWPSFLADLKTKRQDDDAIGLLNQIAKRYILQHEPDRAEDVLLEALKLAEKTDNVQDKSIIQNNLIAIYLYNQNYTKAKSIAEEILKHAKKHKPYSEQGISLIKLAQIQALTENSKIAETTILRKALPIFSRNKDYNNKIKAWISLSQLYINNEKYPEAQWFLIQAQDLAKKENITKYNSTIEYLLGASKYYQNNYIVSQKELTKAYHLAKESGDKHIQLAASHLLTGVNIKLKNADEADFFLKSYWNLRNELF